MGSLATLMKVKNKRINEKECALYIAQMLLALDVLHDKGVIHRVFVLMSYDLGY